MNKSHPTPIPLLIDCDPGLGIKRADVDDSLALFLALASPEVELQGVTVTYGNVDLPTGMQVAKETLAVAKKSHIPLVAGASSAANSVSNSAAEFLVEQVRALPNEFTLITLGPLTNIAAALTIEPRFLSLLKRIVIMGGAVEFPFFGWRGEHNFRHDPKAVQCVLDAIRQANQGANQKRSSAEAALEADWVNMDVCRAVQFTEKHRQMFISHAARNQSDVAQYIAQGVQGWLRIHERYLRLPGFYPWDVIAVAAVIDPTLFNTQLVDLKVKTSGYRRGSLIRNKQTGSDRCGINELIDLDGERFMDMFVSRIIQHF